jgi:DNA-binding CsgD family transcriptional regulator
MIEPGHVVGLLEALYALDLDDEDWLRQTLLALGNLWGAEHHYLGFFYDASNVRDFQVKNVIRAPTPAPELESSWRLFQSLTDPAFVHSTFRSLHVGSARRNAGTYLEPVLAERERNGWGDLFYLNGLDPSGVGCLIAVGSREPELKPPAAELEMLRRLATHLASAFRCRRRLAGANAVPPPLRSGDDAEAVLEPGGRVVHAQGAASGAALEQLSAAAVRIEGVRSKRQRGHGLKALDAWHPLTSARWTLVDSFQEGGRRYIVARENQATSQVFGALTDRERQVVVHAALGMSNKQIAYALGVSDATVRVLMARAAGRVGVRTRKELLDHPVLSELRPAG